MSDKPESQVENWLKKLERESWQLELLVSAFTIFLLIGANASYESFLESLNYEYNMSTPVLAVAGLFLLIIKHSIQALTISLIIHLMLRGFWIGTIGLRSVQPTVDFDKLNYNKFFTEKLRNNGVISLDKMVVQLDEICSVIFAFSFLIISVLIAFAMYLVGLGLLGFVLTQFMYVLPEFLSQIMMILSIVVALCYLFMGLVYMIDYLTLGLFKKIKWFAKIYYPFYRLFNFITLSRLSKSIYYYLISKFSKNRIRLVFAGLGCIALFQIMFEFDQFNYYPSREGSLIVSSNAYDDIRPEDEYVGPVSISSRIISEPFMPVFLRYNPADNANIRGNCPEFMPLKDDGLNTKLTIIKNNGGFNITTRNFKSEDAEQLLACQSSIYQISINDSIYSDLKFRFFVHPHKNQKGILTVIPTSAFNLGENILRVEKVKLDSLQNATLRPFVEIPYWYSIN